MCIQIQFILQKPARIPFLHFPSSPRVHFPAFPPSHHLPIPPSLSEDARVFFMTNPSRVFRSRWRMYSINITLLSPLHPPPDCFLNFIFGTWPSAARRSVVETDPNIAKYAKMSSHSVSYSKCILTPSLSFCVNTRDAISSSLSFSLPDQTFDILIVCSYGGNRSYSVINK